MSKKLPKYKNDALNSLLNWANEQCNVAKDSPYRYTKLVYSEEHASITFYPNDSNYLSEFEVGLAYNVKGRVQFTRSLTNKVITSNQISDEQVSKLMTCVSHVLLKVPYNRTSGRSIERSIGFHYNDNKGQLSVLGSYGSQYIYPSTK